MTKPPNPSLQTDNADVLKALASASAQLQQARIRRTEPLAVVGMACRFPGAPSLEAYWDLLHQGRCAVARVPADRWDPEQFLVAPGKTEGRISTDRIGAVQDIDLFDARFFEISRREATALDPQHRMLMEVSWHAIEHAGLHPESLFGRQVGVYVGICSSDYFSLLNAQRLESIGAYHGIGNSHAAAAGRLSYFLRWEGPAISIDTACSSSLVAMHQAASALRNDECEMALVAGVNAILTPDLSINFSQAGMLSPEGLCRTFADGANGFVRGEGCGAVLLKRLSRALEDGDRIIGCLRGSAVNQDGRSTGLTAPNGLSQQDVIRRALRASRLKASEIDYIEAHGTGTELGDPIELNAIKAVFGDRPSPLRIGSVKTNIGHLEGAAGIAGVIKTCLSLEREKLPKHLHFDRPTALVDWNDSIQVNAEASAWLRDAKHVRRCGISSFGFSGTNAHVILEEAPANAQESQDVPKRPHLIKLTAKSPSALSGLAQAFAEAMPNAEIHDIAMVADTGRADHSHRAATVVESTDDLICHLKSFDDGRDWRLGVVRQPLRVGFFFRPLAAVPIDLANALALSFPVFEHAWQQGLMWAELGDPEATSSPSWSLELIFHMSMTQLWNDWGLRPQGVSAAGRAELSGICAAGAIAWEEAIRASAASNPSDAIRALTTGRLVCTYRSACGENEPEITLARIALADGSIEFADTAASDFEAILSDVCDSPLVDVGATIVDASRPLAGVLSTLCDLYAAGATVDWASVQGRKRQCRVVLPAYPFERQRFWPSESRPDVEHAQSGELLFEATSQATLLGSPVDVSGDVFVWQTDLSQFDYLHDHRVGGEGVFPAAGYLELMLRAAEALEFPTTLRNVVLHRSMPLEDGVSTPTKVQTVLRPDAVGFRCTVNRQVDRVWVEHAACDITETHVMEEKDVVPEPVDLRADLANVEIHCVDAKEHYQRAAAGGLNYGPAFRGLSEMRAENHECVATTTLPAAAGSAGDYLFHPALLDAALQTLAAFIPDSQAGAWLPVEIDSVQMTSDQGAHETLSVRTTLLAADEIKLENTFRFSICDHRRHPLLMIDGLTVRKVALTPAIIGTLGDDQAEVRDFVQRLATIDDDRREEVILDFARDQVARIAELELNEVDVDTPLTTLGLDSIMAIELQNILGHTLGVTVSMELFLRDLSLRDVLRQLAQQTPASKDNLDSIKNPVAEDWVEGAI